MAKRKVKKTPKSQKTLEDMESQSLGTLGDSQTEPELQTNEDGSKTVNFNTPEDTEANEPLEGSEYDYDDKGFYSNLVEQFEQHELDHLGSQVHTWVNQDENSRAEDLRLTEFGLELLGTKLEEKNTPFQGACSAQHPLLMESAVKFQSKASNELLPANGPVKVKVLGDVTLEKEQQANRVKAHMNYQLTEEMTEFYPDKEKLLLSVAIMGSGFTKVYYNAQHERPCSEFVPKNMFVVPNNSPDLHRADRYTHKIPKTDYQLQSDFDSGLYLEPMGGLYVPQLLNQDPVQRKENELGGITVSLNERDKSYLIYECYVMMHFPQIKEDIQSDKYKLASPYIITIDSASQKVLGIRRNWKDGDKKRLRRNRFVHYEFVPAFGFYGYGFIHLLGNLQLTLTSCLRSLVDAGQFANLQGGFKLKGVRISDDGSPISPGQFKEIEAASMDISKALMPLPFKEPSRVLFDMLNFVDAKGQKFADATEHVVSEATNYGPVGTTMALLEASTKFFSAIHKRLHKSLKDELKIIAEINSETLPDELDYNFENETMKVTRADYGPNLAVVPISDPNISSSAQRMAKAQALLQMASTNPTIHDMREVLKHVYTNMDYANIDKILPPPTQAQPLDPISDIQAASMGQPIKAFPGQDHKAHIAIKQAFMQDPMSGQNPMMQKVSIQLQANIQEHMMLGFIEAVQAQMQQSQQQGAQQGQQSQGQMQGQQQSSAPMAQNIQNQMQTFQSPGSPQPVQQGGDPQQLQAMAFAAQKVAQMNMQALQNQAQPQQDPKAQAALMLAHAEVQDTQTRQRKQQADEQYDSQDLKLKAAKLQIDKMKVLHDAHSTGSGQDHELDKLIATKGIDAMIQGMSNLHPNSTTPQQQDMYKQQLDQTRQQMMQLRMQNMQAKINAAQTKASDE